jgi:2-amino-4-hydroxy-6-hydroxymethyldihydropteridine pyrophosphokinase
MAKAVLCIGGNLGNREENIARALDLLEQDSKTEILSLSNIYETEPYDVLSKQPNYLNACILIETEYLPMELLAFCHEIEKALQRVRLEYHGARTMDVDILLYENYQSDNEVLTIPHRGILERAFVLVPLSDLFPHGAALDFQFDAAREEIDKSGVRLYI